MINKIKGNQPQGQAAAVVEQQVVVQPQSAVAVAVAVAATAPDPLHHYYQLQFYQQYGYWPQVDQAPPLPPTQQQQQQYVQFTPPSTNKEASSNPYAQIVSNVHKTKTEEDVDPPAVTTAAAAVTAAAAMEAPIVEVVQQPSLFSLAQYSGSESDADSDDANEDGGDVIPIPPADVQVIVDKMASYVAKNGIDFENIVKAKGDPRFVFLEAKHLYNPYYKTKLREYLGQSARTGDGGPASEVNAQNIHNSQKINQNNDENKEDTNNGDKKQNENKHKDDVKDEEKPDKKANKSKEKKIISNYCIV